MKIDAIKKKALFNTEFLPGWENVSRQCDELLFPILCDRLSATFALDLPQPLFIIQIPSSIFLIQGKTFAHKYHKEGNYDWPNNVMREDPAQTCAHSENYFKNMSNLSFCDQKVLQKNNTAVKFTGCRWSYFAQQGLWVYSAHVIHLLGIFWVVGS